MLELDFMNGWMNYKHPTDPAKDRKNVCPAIWVNNLIFSLNDNDSEYQLAIQVNDHCYNYLELLSIFQTWLITNNYQLFWQGRAFSAFLTMRRLLPII